MLSVMLAAMFGACSKDTPFDNEIDSAMGSLSTSGLKVSLNSEYGPMPVKGRGVRKAAPAVGLFDVEIVNQSTGAVVRSFKYADMPEIVTLPVGTYTVRASYGDNKDAAWEEPYYMGELRDVEIIKDEITEVSEPVTCKFANIRVSIDFEPSLKAVMGSDCKVEVNVGERGSLQFTVNDVDRSGYFRFVNDSETLAAEFSGTVDKVMTQDSQAFTGVKAGSWYKITFKLFDAGEDEPGNIVGGEGGLIMVVAEVESSDMNLDVDFEAPANGAEDNERPKEDWTEPGTGEENPGVGEDPSKGSKPTIVAEAPIVLDQEYDYPKDGNGPAVVINVHSDSDEGIKTFTVAINMAGVPESDLTDMNLAPVMDLVNPEASYKASLQGLGFPVEVGGEKDVRIEISSDLLNNLLTVLPGLHQFKLNVGDEYGNVTKSLLIRIK